MVSDCGRYWGRLSLCQGPAFLRNFKGLPPGTICCGSKHSRPWLGQQEPGGSLGRADPSGGSSANMTCLKYTDTEQFLLARLLKNFNLQIGRDGISHFLMFLILVGKIDSCSVISLITPIFVKEMSCWSSMSILFRVLQQSPDTGAT